MKYYSEILEQFYDDADKLIADETAHLEMIAAEEARLEEQKKKETNRKKTLATAIEVADAELEKAYKEFEAAKESCKKILDESNAKMVEILKPATELVKNAERARLDAVKAFNKEFGVFKTSYTGERAQKEFERSSKIFEELFKHCFRF